MVLQEIIDKERPRSRGPFHDPVTSPFDRIIVGDAFRINPKFLAGYRITHVINCADPSLKVLNYYPDRYECIDAIDSEDINIFDTWYPKFKETLDRFLRSPNCINVYVHCHAGMNRSASLAAAYVVKTFRVPVDRCVERMVRQRPCVLTNRAFVQQLEDFAKKDE